MQTHPLNPDQQLERAIWCHDEAEALAALGQGANTNLLVNGSPVIGWMVELQMLDALREFLHRGANPNLASQQNATTALHTACFMQDPFSQALLLQAGADPNACDHHAETPLHLISFCHDMRAAGVLLAHGANVNARNKWGTSPLHYAVRGDELPFVDLLLHHGADMHVVDHHVGTVLHAAAGAGGKLMIKFLVGQGLHVDARDRRGRTPLHHVVLEDGNDKTLTRTPK